MTKFDLDATPLCDANLILINTNGASYVCLSLETGVQLERRARVAEQKLRIALDALNMTASYHWEYTVCSQYIRTALEEIERVEK